MEDLSELELEGLVQRLEYTFELSWKVLQDLLVYKGYEFNLAQLGTLRHARESLALRPLRRQCYGSAQ